MCDRSNVLISRVENYDVGHILKQFGGIYHIYPGVILLLHLW